MRFYLLLLFLTGFLFQSQAQTMDDTTVCFVKDTINPIDVQPAYPGGNKAFNKFLLSNLIYPPSGKAGTTYIQFIIEKDGSLSNIKAVEGKGLNQSSDEEAIRVLSNSPKWTPGMKNDLPVRTRMVRQFTFGVPGN